MSDATQVAGIITAIAGLLGGAWMTIRYSIDRLSDCIEANHGAISITIRHETVCAECEKKAALVTPP